MDGCRELVIGNEDEALQDPEQAAHLADGGYLAGFLALKKERLKEAEGYLTTAAEKHNRLRRYFDRVVADMVDRLSRSPLELCPHNRAFRHARRELRLGDPGVSHDQLHGAAPVEDFLILRPARASDDFRAHAGRDLHRATHRHAVRRDAGPGI